MEEKVNFSPQAFYDELVTAQEFIQGELAFVEMTRQIGRSKRTAGDEAAADLLLKMKDYWMAQYFAELRNSGDSKQLVEAYNAHENRGRVKRHVDMLVLDKNELAKHIAEIKVKEGEGRNDEVDYLTFSVLPSLFRFFVFESETKKFIGFLKRIRENAKDWDESRCVCKRLLRLLFRTPHFLRYVEAVMSPFLRRMLTGMRQIKTEDERVNFMGQQVAMLSQECEKPESQRLFPRMFREIYNDDIIESIFGAEYQVSLMQMFLEDLARCPQKFMGWKYHEGLSTELKFDETAANILAEVIFGKKEKEKALLGTSLVTIKVEDIDPGVCARLVLNNRDLSILKLSNLQTKDNEYTVHVIPYDCGRRSQLELTMTQTQLNHGPLVAGLRKLLKAAPPLRRGMKCKDEFSNEYRPNDLVRDVLVAPCEPECIIPQFEALQDLEDVRWTAYESIDTLRELFENMFVQHQTTMRQLVKEQKLAQALRTTQKICEPAMRDLPKFVGVALIKHEIARNQKLRSFEWHDAISYVHHPSAFHSRLKEWLDLFKSESSVPTLKHGLGTAEGAAWLHFHYICSAIGLDFATYRAVNNHLQTYDSMLESFMARGRSDTEFHSERERADFKDIVAFRRALASGTELQAEAAEVFRTNFDPLTKSDEFLSLMMKVVDYYENRYCLSDGDVGFALLEKIQRIFFTYGWNPTCLASFYGYMNDFVVPWTKSYALRGLDTLIRDSCNQMGIPMWTLSRISQLAHKVAFVGDDEAKQTIFGYLAHVDKSVFSSRTAASHFSAVVPDCDGSKAFVFEVFAVSEAGKCEQSFSSERKPDIDVFISSRAFDEKLKSDLKCFKNCKIAIAFNGTETAAVKPDNLLGGKVPALTIPQGENNQNSLEIILDHLKKTLDVDTWILGY